MSWTNGLIRKTENQQYHYHRFGTTVFLNTLSLQRRSEEKTRRRGEQEKKRKREEEKRRGREEEKWREGKKERERRRNKRRRGKDFGMEKSAVRVLCWDNILVIWGIILV